MKRHSDSQFKPSRFRAAIAIICWSLCALSAASGATITVTSTSDSGPGSLRQAIKDAAAGDTINFSVPANGIINLTTDELLIDKSLTITGPGANTLRVQNGANFRVFEIIQPAVNVSISGLSIAHGVADFGGGIVCYSVNLTVASCTISQNSAGFFGGGILFSGDGLLTITNSTIADNFTSGLNSLGGGVGVFAKDGPNDKKAMIINSTISGNHASGSGGGICYSDQTNNPGATLTLANTTVTNNYTQSSDGGGVVNGKSDFPGGVLYVHNSIIAGNTVPAGKTGPDFAGDLTSQGYNIIGDVHGTGFNQAPGDQLGVNPKLDALQDNGGPTPTHALRSGSPAIDAGNSGGAFVDQRGYARPVDGSVPNPSGGDGSDIGAYEVQADQLPGCNNVNHTVNNNDDSGAGSLRDIIANVCNGTTIDFAPNVRGAINLTSGELVINNSLTINGPGANLLSVQRSTAAGTPEFRIFDIVGNRNVAISGLTISNGKVSGNISFAGGILNSGAGTLTLTGSTVSGNSAGFIGGGIANNGTLLLTNSTVSGNVANNGGGISGGTVIAINSTIADNMAQSGDAGGIFVQTVTLTNSTISGNSASGSGGGVFNNGNNGASIRAKNTIIALNNAASGPDVSGALTSENFNLIGNVSGGTITPAQFGDLLGSADSPIDPKLGPLKDNGGPTPTFALLSGSPAIDHASSFGLTGSLTTDQRGVNRTSDFPSVANVPNGDGADIGAFELPKPSPSPTPTATPKSTPTATPKATPTATPKATPPSQLQNLSTRKQVGSGQNVLIGGFIVVGTENKKVLLRGLGPSLPVTGRLANPVLELHRADTTLLAANDNWKDKQANEITATGIPPGNDLESAIVISLAAKPVAEHGAGYSGVLAGKGGTTGIGLLEIYDLATAAKSKLANISTRGFVGVDPNFLIGGFIPGPIGRTPLKVLVRALGPSLTGQRVAGALQDPVLELHDKNGTLLTNDNWKDASNAAEIQATLPPPDDRESAIITTLAPSEAGYTAVVRGADGATGTALVEVYALQ